jgi:hypothetical protein
MNFKGAPLKNKELQLIYLYLVNKLTRAELSDQLGRTRTNTYYYVGRAAHYWIRIGVLKLRKIKGSEELGGKDINIE